MTVILSQTHSVTCLAQGDNLNVQVSLSATLLLDNVSATATGVHKNSSMQCF